MTWNPWTTIKKLGEELAEFEKKYGVLEGIKNEFSSRLAYACKERDELNERIAVLEERLADSEFSLSAIKLEVKSAVDTFAPSTAVLKSNKAMRIELDSAKSALEKVRFVLER